MVSTSKVIIDMVAIALFYCCMEAVYAKLFSTTFASCACTYSFAFACGFRLMPLKEISLRGYYLSVVCILFLMCAEIVFYYTVGPETTYYWLKCFFSFLFALIWLASHGVWKL